MSRDRSGGHSAGSDEQVQAQILADALSRIADERITVIENGRRRKISKREANVTALVNAAVKGDRLAIKTLLRYLNEMKSAPQTKQKAAIIVDEYGIPYPR
jgi:hypothetical protein